MTIRRREFITLLGGAAAAAWSLAARAQQSPRIRRVAVLMQSDESDPRARAQFAPFVQGLRSLGIDGQTMRMDVRWNEGHVERARAFATDLIGLAPDVILLNHPEPDRIGAAGSDDPDRFHARVRSGGAGLRV
jgi:hypothetical protein